MRNAKLITLLLTSAMLITSTPDYLARGTPLITQSEAKAKSTPPPKIKYREQWDKFGEKQLEDGLDQHCSGKYDYEVCKNSGCNS